MINTVTLIGRLTKDPELRQTAGNTPVLSFTLAVNRNFKNQEGNIEADFINCVIWRKPAEILAQYTRKGSQIAVRGRLQTRSYDDKTGHRVYVTEVVCDDFQLLDRPRQDQGMNNSMMGGQSFDSGMNSMDSNPYSAPVSSFQPTSTNDNMNQNHSMPMDSVFSNTGDIVDEDLPF